MRSVNRLKKDVYTELKKHKFPNLISLSIVGSFPNMKTAKSVTDIDIVVLVSQLNLIIFKRINHEFSIIAKNLNTPNEKFFVENRIAAVKKSVIKRKRVFQLHILVFEKSWFIKNKYDPLLFDWVNFNKKLIGNELKNVIKIPILNKNYVINDLINKRLPALNKKIAYGGIYKIKGGKLILKDYHIPLKDDEYAESVCQAITISFLNYIRLTTPNFIKTEKNILKTARKRFSDKYYLLLKKVLLVKEKLGHGKKINKKELGLIRRDGKDFIIFLSKDIRKTFT